MTFSALLIAACSVLVLGCAGDTGAPRVVREQRGDTSVVLNRGSGAWGDSARLARVASFGTEQGNDTTALGRIAALALGPDGRVFALDAALPAVRVFTANLEPQGIWSRSGSGPGELRNPDNGLAVLSDGRVVVRDPGNGRIQVLRADGSAGDSWMIINPQIRTRENFAPQGDTLLSRIVLDAQRPITEWQFALMRIAPDGRVLDTIAIPDQGLPPLTLRARRGNNNAELPLPFAPSAMWAWHPAGGFALARGDRYAIVWPRSGGLVRAERDVPAEPVTSVEREQERAYVTKGLQWLDPTWQWTGPEIPQTKPFLRALFAAADGRVWALREGAAVEADDPEYQPNQPSSVERRWRSSYVFDVFAADGEFLGSVAAPAGLQLRPAPVMLGDVLTGLELDASGTPQLVRYKIERGGGAP